MDIIEVELKCTCESCPTQYRGSIGDVPYYFRYRGGHWLLELDTPGESVEFLGEYGSWLDGAMSDEMVRGIILGVTAAYFGQVEVKFLVTA